MRIRIDLKIFIFLALFYFTHQLRIYLIIMLFSIIHEIGHIIVGLILKIKLEKIEIMPFGITASFYSDFKESKIKEIFVALAGPIVSLAMAFLGGNFDITYIANEEFVYSNILICIFNLIPIYPLDGGRIIKGILYIILGSEKSEILMNKISNITIIILTIISSIAVYYYKNIAIFLICIFLWSLSLKEKKCQNTCYFARKIVK